MAKAPVCGAVKSRLAKEIGLVKAVALYRCLTARLLRETVHDPRFRTVLAITPDPCLHAPFAAWTTLRGKQRSVRRASVSASGEIAWTCRNPRLAGVHRLPQGLGDIGERMQRTFDRCEKGPLIIIGTDIPFVSAETIADAFRRLASADVIFGPAEDGGYWLVGFRRLLAHPRPFRKVRWSSAQALLDTQKNLSGCRVGFARTLYDVDNAQDYRRYLRDQSERYR